MCQLTDAAFYTSSHLTEPLNYRGYPVPVGPYSITEVTPSPSVPIQLTRLPRQTRFHSILLYRNLHASNDTRWHDGMRRVHITLRCRRPRRCRSP